MATVVITLFLFGVNCKMDADYLNRRPRENLISRRNSRWSMNSHKLEAIVAELMKPISDARRNFDTDLSALLEEYLTEAGLHALDAGERAPDDDEDVVTPNFSELALLLQQSATIYGKKVDFLYQHVLEVSDSLLNSMQEANTSTVAEAAPVASARRKRKASAAAAAGAGGAEFAALSVARAAGARRAPDAPRPPPTLPRMYAELAPAAAAAARDPPLHDYLGEPIGLLADFHLSWRLHEGLLVDDLQGASWNSESALRAIPLVELQAAIEAAATPPLSAPSPPPSPGAPPLASTPLAAPGSPHTPHTPDTPVTPNTLDTPVSSHRKERKRRSVMTIDDFAMQTVKLIITKELRDQWNELREFSIPPLWIAKVVKKRKRYILSERRRLRAEEDALSAGFAGWSSSEAAEAVAAAAARCKTCALELESDDDGFFEQSSLGELDASRTERAAEPEPGPGRAAEQAAWQARVLQRAGAAGGADVRELGARVLAALAPAPARAPFPRVLAAAARAPPDVSRLLLATLFLANAGNVEIVQGPPLSVNSFSVRVLSTDERLYSAVAADEQFLR